jgi:hypothetical protein
VGSISLNSRRSGHYSDEASTREALSRNVGVDAARRTEVLELQVGSGKQANGVNVTVTRSVDMGNAQPIPAKVYARTDSQEAVNVVEKTDAMV